MTTFLERLEKLGQNLHLPFGENLLNIGSVDPDL